MKILKSLIIGLIALVLVTVGIDAADNYDNVSNSLVGRILGVEEKGPCPEDMVFVSTENGGFCIDKYEVSPGEDCPVEEIKNELDTRKNLDRKDCSPISSKDKSPWRFISQVQAMNACAKAGKRLPSSEEWYLASLGTPDSEGEPGENDCQIDSNWESQPGLTGTGESCVSGIGAYDMIGNVWEWVKGEINEGMYKEKQLPEEGYVNAVDIDGLTTETDLNNSNLDFNNDYFWIKKSGTRGMARGGYWRNGAGAGMYAMYLVSPSNFIGAGVGFRCAK